MTFNEWVKHHDLSFFNRRTVAQMAWNAAQVAAREECCDIVTGLCVSDNNAREINEAIRKCPLG